MLFHPESKYYEDLQLGDHFVTASHTVTREEVQEFVRLFRLENARFLDEGYARDHSVFGRPVVPGLMVQAIATALFGHTCVMAYSTAAFMGSHLRNLAPLNIGDTMHVEVEVSGKKKTNKPDRGVVTLLATVTNQDGEAVASYTETLLVWRRPEPLLRST